MLSWINIAFKIFKYSLGNKLSFTTNKLVSRISRISRRDSRHAEIKGSRRRVSTRVCRKIVNQFLVERA